MLGASKTQSVGDGGCKDFALLENVRLGEGQASACPDEQTLVPPVRSRITASASRSLVTPIIRKPRLRTTGFSGKLLKQI
jgi:hypothetical protein